jgi:hypothetical protein
MPSAAGIPPEWDSDGTLLHVFDASGDSKIWRFYVTRGGLIAVPFGVWSLLVWAVASFFRQEWLARRVLARLGIDEEKGILSDRASQRSRRYVRGDLELVRLKRCTATDLDLDLQVKGQKNHRYRLPGANTTVCRGILRGAFSSVYQEEGWDGVGLFSNGGPGC